MANIQEVFEQKAMIDDVTNFLWERNVDVEPMLLLDAMEKFGYKLTRADEKDIGRTVSLDEVVM